jgi:3-isopropylmalate/(R)-2-methylmalate dehydratase small subunit
MEKLTAIRSVGAPMAMKNVDTDMIIPSQFLKTVSRKGLGKYAFNNVRYDHDGNPFPGFVLNKESYRNAEILIALDNFGCGSSREHAVWALMEIGIRCVIAPSFGEIFSLNSLHNGLLLIALTKETIEDLLAKASRGSNAVFNVDIVRQEITDPDGEVIRFEIDGQRKDYLLQGENDQSFISQRSDSIHAFERKQAAAQPWAWRHLRR